MMKHRHKSGIEWDACPQCGAPLKQRSRYLGCSQCNYLADPDAAIDPTPRDDAGRHVVALAEDSKRNLHCWHEGPETDDGCSTTCMLPRDHDGPHEWTRDDEIMVTFAPQPAA